VTGSNPGCRHSAGTNSGASLQPVLIAVPIGAREAQSNQASIIAAVMRAQVLGAILNHTSPVRLESDPEVRRIVVLES
jgi:hypothetical protein